MADLEKENVTPVTVLLKSWHLEDEDTVIQRFIENGIETKHLKELTDELLKELCPKICTRLHLKNKITEYLTAETNTSTLSTAHSVPECSTTDFDELLEIISCRPPFPDFDLKTLLSTSPTGNSILTYYNTQKQLTNKHRNNLTDIISRRIFTRVVNHRINHEEYNIITAKIIALFPTESAGTYFVPPIKKRDSISGKPSFARGKLVDKIRNTLYTSGERKRKSHQGNQNDVENSKRSKNIEDLEAQYKDDIIWLKNNSEPWEDVIIKWKSTSQLRQLQQTGTVGEFIKLWPTLNDTRSDVLINLDFDAIYPQRTNNFFVKWKDFIKKIQEIRRSNSKEEIANLMEYIDGLVDDDHKLPFQIKLLCYLVPPKGRLNKRQKFSTTECLETFVVSVENPGDIQKKIEEISTDASGKHQTVQPYIIHCLSHEDIGGIYYLIIDKVSYVYNSAFKAFDTLFKCYHALHVCYPKSGYHLYLLIQICVYNISTKYDVIPPYISDLVSNAKC